MVRFEGGGGGSGWGGQGRCERRIEVFVKIQNKIFGGGVRSGGRGCRVGGRVEGGQAGCERRIEVFVKIQKKIGGGGVRGVGLMGSGWM